MSASQPSRFRGRPVLLVLVLVATAAAVTWLQLRDDRSERPQAAAPASERAAAPANPDPGRGPDSRQPAASSTAPAIGAPPTADEFAGDENRITVAIDRASVPDDDTATIRAFQSIYSAFLASLREAPHLRVIDVDPADPAFEPDDYDFVLSLRGQIEFEPDPVWTFGVRWEATRGGDGSWTTSRSATDSPDIELIGREAAADLQRFPLPPAAGRITELGARSLDTGLSLEARYELIDELAEIPERFEFVGRDVARVVAVTAVDIVAGSRDAEVRSRVWIAMREAGSDDPYLLQPVLDSLQNDPDDDVRLEAIRLAASRFRDDPRIASALAYAREGDASPEVRTHAQWETLDASGRRDYVATTLMNDDLTAAERIALLRAGVTGLPTYVHSEVASTLLRRRLAEIGDGSFAGAGAMAGDAADVLPLLLEQLENPEHQGMRIMAASMLLPYLADPRVRAALEQMSRSEPSFFVRVQIQSALAR